MTSKDPRRWWALTAMSLAVFLVAVDGTVLSLATPSIVKDLQPTASQVLWIGDIYSFVLAGLLITMGNVGDRVGRKRLLLIGGTAFALISIPAAAYFAAHDRRHFASVVFMYLMMLMTGSACGMAFISWSNRATNARPPGAFQAV